MLCTICSREGQIVNNNHFKDKCLIFEDLRNFSHDVLMIVFLVRHL
jgi:hypothetical protein